MLRVHLLDLLEAYGQTWGAGWLDFPGRDLAAERAALARLRDGRLVGAAVLRP